MCNVARCTVHGATSPIESAAAAASSKKRNYCQRCNYVFAPTLHAESILSSSFIAVFPSLDRDCLSFFSIAQHPTVSSKLSMPLENRTIQFLFPVSFIWMVAKGKENGGNSKQTTSDVQYRIGYCLQLKMQLVKVIYCLCSRIESFDSSFRIALAHGL